LEMVIQTDFASIVPPAWASQARPFLARAAEFGSKQPLVAYYLYTHVAFLCIKNRASSNAGKEGTQFLMKLLGELENEKVALHSELEKSDGRTVLTRTALSLFALADDKERAGEASLAIVKLFFTASLLFEATAQYLEGSLDPIASEKSKYAKFVASKMKRSLESGTPYVSHNPVDVSEAADNTNTIPATSQVVTNVPPPQPSSAQPAISAPQFPPATQPTHPAMSQPQPVAVFQPPVSFHAAPATAPVQPSPTQPVALMPSVVASTGGAGPSMDAMIDAQRYCKQAVSALQFYDHENAKRQLLQALALLS